MHVGRFNFDRRVPMESTQKVDPDEAADAVVSKK
jgi:hypothetical protein